jgi:DNA recombination protein RmuC
VLVATPTTLIALLRTVAIYWQQESLARNAAHIAEVARTLFSRVGKFRDHVENVGKRLEGAVKSYNQAVNSFQSRVVPMGRRLEEMRVAPAGELEDLKGIEDVPRTYLVEGDEDAPPEGDAEFPS